MGEWPGKEVCAGRVAGQGGLRRESRHTYVSLLGTGAVTVGIREGFDTSITAVLNNIRITTERAASQPDKTLLF